MATFASVATVNQAEGLMSVCTGVFASIRGRPRCIDCIPA